LPFHIVLLGPHRLARDEGGRPTGTTLHQRGLMRKGALLLGAKPVVYASKNGSSQKERASVSAAQTTCRAVRDRLGPDQSSAGRLYGASWPWSRRRGVVARSECARTWPSPVPDSGATRPTVRRHSRRWSPTRSSGFYGARSSSRSSMPAFGSSPAT